MKFIRHLIRNRLLLLLFLCTSIFNLKAGAVMPKWDSCYNYLRINNDFISNPAFTGFTDREEIGNLGVIFDPKINTSDKLKYSSEYLEFMQLVFGKRINVAIGGFYDEYRGEIYESKKIGGALAVNWNSKKLGKISAGFSALKLSETTNYDLMIFGDQINPRLGPIYPSVEKYAMTGPHEISNIIYNAGIFYAFRDYFYAGYSKLNLTQPINSLYEDDRVYISSSERVTAGGNARICKNLSLNLTAIYQWWQQDLFNSFTPTLSVGYKNNYLLGAGLSVANSDIIAYHINFNADIIKHINLRLRYEMIPVKEGKPRLTTSYFGMTVSFYLNKNFKF
jgi:hypothetical protein